MNIKKLFQKKKYTSFVGGFTTSPQSGSSIGINVTTTSGTNLLSGGASGRVSNINTPKGTGLNSGQISFGNPNFNIYTATSGSYTMPEKEYCELCGEETNLDWEVKMKDMPALCDKCLARWQREWMVGSIPKDSKVHCPTCHKHIKACKCPDSEALREMAE